MFVDPSETTKYADADDDENDHNSSSTVPTYSQPLSSLSPSPTTRALIFTGLRAPSRSRSQSPVSHPRKLIQSLRSSGNVNSSSTGSLNKDKDSKDNSGSSSMWDSDGNNSDTSDNYYDNDSSNYNDEENDDDDIINELCLLSIDMSIRLNLPSSEQMRRAYYSPSMFIESKQSPTRGRDREREREKGGKIRNKSIGSPIQTQQSRRRSPVHAMLAKVPSAARLLPSSIIGTGTTKTSNTNTNTVSTVSPPPSPAGSPSVSPFGSPAKATSPAVPLKISVPSQQQRLQHLQELSNVSSLSLTPPPSVFNYYVNANVNANANTNANVNNSSSNTIEPHTPNKLEASTRSKFMYLPGMASSNISNRSPLFSRPALPSLVGGVGVGGGGVGGGGGGGGDNSTNAADTRRVYVAYSSAVVHTTVALFMKSFFTFKDASLHSEKFDVRYVNPDNQYDVIASAASTIDHTNAHSYSSTSFRFVHLDPNSSIHLAQLQRIPDYNGTQTVVVFYPVKHNHPSIPIPALSEMTQIADVASPGNGNGNGGGSGTSKAHNRLVNSLLVHGFSVPSNDNNYGNSGGGGGGGVSKASVVSGGVAGSNHNHNHTTAINTTRVNNNTNHGNGNGSGANPAVSKGYIMLSPLPHGQCTLEMTVTVIVPERIARNTRRLEHQLDSCVNIVKKSRLLFYRGDEVDDDVATEFINNLPIAPPLTSQEAALITTSLTMALGDFKRDKRPSDPSDQTSRFTRRDMKGNFIVHKWSGIMHASSARALAYFYNHASNERMAVNKATNNDLARYQTDLVNPASHSRLVNGVNYFPGFNNRLFDNVFVWSKVEDYMNTGNTAYVMGMISRGDFVIPGETAPSFSPLPSKVVRRVTRGVMIFEEIAPNVSKVTLVQSADAGGLIQNTISDKISAYALSIFTDLQVKLCRKGCIVDGEVWENFAAKLVDCPPVLNEEQMEVMRVAQDLADEYDSCAGVATRLLSPSCQVPMSLKHLPPKKTNRAIATGRVTATIDATPEAVAAFLFEVCSNKRTQAGIDSGNPVRLEISNVSYYDKTFAKQVKHYRWPVHRREYVVRQVVDRSPLDGVVRVASVSVDVDVDYGVSKIEIVTGKVLALFKITPHAATRCNGKVIDSCGVEMTQTIDPLGLIPVAVVNSTSIPSALSLLHELRGIFQRDEEVDETERSAVVEEMKRVVPSTPYTRDEEGLVERCIERYRQAEGAQKTVRLSKDALIRTYSFYLKANSNANSNANVSPNANDDGTNNTNISSMTNNTTTFCLHSDFIVDTTPEQAAAYVYCVKSRSALAAFDVEGGETVEFERVNAHRQVVRTIVKRSSIAMLTRRGLCLKTEQVWKCVDEEEEGGGEGKTKNKTKFIAIASESTDAGRVSIVKKRRDTFFGPSSIYPSSNPSPNANNNPSSSSCSSPVSSMNNTNNSKLKVTPLITSSKRLKRWSYLRIERVPTVTDSTSNSTSSLPPQTRVRFYSQLILGVSAQLAEEASILSLQQHTRAASRLRVYYDRSREVDQFTRTQFIKKVTRGGGGVYSDFEKTLLKNGKHMLRTFQGDVNTKSITSNSPAVTFEVGKAVESVSQMGRAKAVIRAPILEVLAYFWQSRSRVQARVNHFTSTYEDDNNNSDDGSEKYKSSLHYKVMHVVRRAPAPFTDRDFVGRYVWRINEGDDSVIVCSEPYDEGSDSGSGTGSGSSIGSGNGGSVGKMTSSSKGSSSTDNGYSRGAHQMIRGKLPFAVLLHPVSASETSVEYVMQLDFGKRVPSFLMNMFVAQQLRKVTALQHYYQEIRPLEELDDKDGTALAESLVLCRRGGWGRGGRGFGSGEGKGLAGSRRSTEETIRRHVSLAGVSAQHEFFEPMLLHMIHIDLSLTKALSSSSLSTTYFYNRKKKLSVLVQSDGEKLARVLRMLLITSANEGIAVRRFTEKGRAMDEFSEKFPFFPALVSRMCHRLVSEFTLYKLYECSKKVVSSMADVGTDIATAIVYLDENDPETSQALFLLIGISLTVQLVFAVFNHVGNWRMMLREMLYTLFFVRGGVLHFRVLTKQEPAGYEMLDCINEAIIYKGVEVITESIPGSFIQLTSMLGDKKEIAPIKIISFVISAALVSLTVANMEVRKETDLTHRSLATEFYGFIPESGYANLIVTTSMKIMFTAQFFIRVFFCSIVGMRNTAVLIEYLVAEFSVVMAYKFYFGAARWWLPLKGSASISTSLVMRFFALEVTAATSALGCRHPFELGGFMWLLIHLTTHSGLLVVTHFIDQPQIPHIDEVRQFSFIFVCVWWTCFAVLMTLGEKKYRHTFYDMTTGAQFQKILFDTGNDEAKSKLFTIHSSLWIHFRSEIVEWLEEGWEGWTSRNPEFFNEDWIKRIPKDMLPDSEVRSSSSKDSRAQRYYVKTSSSSVAQDSGENLASARRGEKKGKRRASFMREGSGRESGRSDRGRRSGRDRAESGERREKSVGLEEIV